MGKAILLFEPITDRQVWKIQALIAGKSLKELAEFNEAVSKLDGATCIQVLSKQEAIFLIEGLLGQNMWPRPLPARTAGEIKGDTSGLPSWGHVKQIRMWARDLGWGSEKLAEWLMKTVKVESIRNLDRASARNAFVAMQYVVKSRN